MVYTMPLPAIISAVGGLVGAGANALAQRAANNRSFQQTKQLFGMQVQDRNSQNVYNSPSNQVAMLKAAGLSPASFYGGAAQSAGSAGVVTPGSPEVGAADLSTPFSGAAGQISNLTMLGSQRENLESQTNKNFAEVAKLFSESARNKFDLEMAETLKHTTIAQANANLDKTIKDAALTEAQRILSSVETEYRRVGIKLTESQIGLNDEQKKLWNEQMKRLGVENLESYSRIKLNASNAALADSTARQVCYSIEHLMPAIVADYAASADLKTTQGWNQQESAKFQQWYNDHMLDYLPDELQSKIDNMDANTKAVTQGNIRDWIKLPAEFLRDAGIGIGAVAGPISQMFGASPAKIGFK